MLNKVWFWLLLAGILYGFGKGAWQSRSAWATSCLARGKKLTLKRPTAKIAKDAKEYGELK